MALFGCYRRDEATDPDTYTTAVTAILTGYPFAVVRRVVDPRFGLPSKLKFLPTVAEIREACEAEIAPAVRKAQRERQAAEQRAETRRWEEQRKQPRPSAEQIKAQYGPNWGLTVEPKEKGRGNANMDHMLRTNSKLFRDECAAAGVDPGYGVSPSLIKLLQEQGHEVPAKFLPQR